jgi:hypothetical protein
MTISTNAIRSFSDRVRNATQNIVLTPQEARALNFEISKLMAYVVEMQSQPAPAGTDVELQGGKF